MSPPYKSTKYKIGQISIKQIILIIDKKQKTDFQQNWYLKNCKKLKSHCILQIIFSEKKRQNLLYLVKRLMIVFMNDSKSPSSLENWKTTQIVQFNFK